VVLQQVQNPAGDLQQRTVIDGQQRLTTLQILLDAIHAEVSMVGADAAAARIEPLVENAKPFQKKPEDKFKIWPTNKDRDAFNEVMGQPFPIDYSKLKSQEHRLVQAHEYFSLTCRSWLLEESESGVVARAEALERSVRELVQIVVIDLAPQENAQEIFETLNARGLDLTASDLLKNYLMALVARRSETDLKHVLYQWSRITDTVGIRTLPDFLRHHLNSRQPFVRQERLFKAIKADVRTAEDVFALLDELERSAVLYQALQDPLVWSILYLLGAT
jgi:hypothetical protein